MKFTYTIEQMTNMECYFRRHGWTVASNAIEDFLPGDIVNRETPGAGGCQTPFAL